MPGDFNGDGYTDFGWYVTPIDSEHMVSVSFHVLTISDQAEGGDKIGFRRPSTNRFYLDVTGDDTWNGTGGGDTITRPWS